MGTKITAQGIAGASEPQLTLRGVPCSQIRFFRLENWDVVQLAVEPFKYVLVPFGLQGRYRKQQFCASKSSRPGVSNLKGRNCMRKSSDWLLLNQLVLAYLHKNDKATVRK